MYEVCGEKELKVILALDPGDSISGVARKIDENRETIRRVVNRLEEAGYVVYDDGLQLVDQTIRDAGLEFLTAATDISPPSIRRRTSSRSSRVWSMHSLPSMRSTSGPAVATRSLATQRTIRCSSPSTNPNSTPGRSSSIGSESRLRKSASPQKISTEPSRSFWSHGHKSMPRWSTDGPSSHPRNRGVRK